MTHRSLRRVACRIKGHSHSRLYCRDCKQHYWVCLTCGDHP
jgi:hypothetical protein